MHLHSRILLLAVLVVALAIAVPGASAQASSSAPPSFVAALGALNSKFAAGAGIVAPNTKSKSLCAPYVTWQIDGARSGQAQVAIETQLQTAFEASVSKNETVALQTMFPVCLEALQRFICTQAFPVCSSGINKPGLPCLSTCTDVLDRCAIPFTIEGKQALLPPCASQQLNSFFDRTPTCNKVTAKLGSIMPPAPCPSYMATNPDGELNPLNAANNTLGGQCFGRCCFPAPKMQLFYKEGQVTNINKLSVYVRAVSSVFALFVFLSYLVLPNKRKHPAIIVFFFAMAMTFWMGNIWMSFPDPRRVQCAVDAQSPDGLSPWLESRFATNQLCTIQGTFLVFFSHLTIVWAVYLVLNLHLTAVWRSNFLERNFHLTSLFCWMWPMGFTIAAYAMSAIEYDAGATCFISVAQSGALFFYPLAGLIGVASILHIGTFGSIARSSFKETMSLESSGVRSQTVSANYGEKFTDPYTGESTYGPAHSQSMGSGAAVSGRHKAKHAARAVKVQWRALMLAFQLIVTYLVFFLFYNFESPKLDIKGNEPWFRDWVKCTMIDRLGQNTCATQAAPNLPSLWLMVATDMIVASAGTVLFVIFGARLSLVYEWRTWFANLGGRRAAEPYAGYL
ncbi:hypothetical protein BC828DRAFT_403551 [Blastocladiella britannica]|nr:hypothetical protein BC828DRAFT_403551 [Blastocladiella britannica]